MACGSRVIETGLPLVYLNMVGSQDEQVFDGASFVLNHGGSLARQLPFCDEGISRIDFMRTRAAGPQMGGCRVTQPYE